METCEKVLDTVDQLLIDNAIIGEVRNHHCNLAVAYDDYQKAYGMVHHDWMLRVYEWMGIESNVRNVIEEVKRWKTRLEVRNGNKLFRSPWIDIKKRYLQR